MAGRAAELSQGVRITDHIKTLGASFAPPAMAKAIRDRPGAYIEQHGS
ncbi:MAG: hypothetical protein HY649_01825 [Acidobacteria bacterium]|nr:hypothetical protein [Acidobacteriota bacterium]